MSEADAGRRERSPGRRSLTGLGAGGPPRAGRRVGLADRRDAAATLREQALLPVQAEAGLSARGAAQLRLVNERLVLATVAAQARTEAAEQVTGEMAYRAQHDCLTGLPNRALLLDRLEQALAFARRNGQRVALMFLDLDHFKQVNDTFGHPVGDRLLQSTARRLQGSVRLSDTVCRQGGDEFVLLLPDVPAAADAALSARKLVAAMAPPHRIGGHRIDITLSLGISLYPDDAADAETLLRHADIAMYHAKRNGRNQFHMFTRS
jgi:diguanylate cyclase (GGDEF)-like protein